MTNVVAATYTVSSGELDLAYLVVLLLIVWVGFAVYRSSERVRLAYGTTPWRVPTWAWVLIAVIPPLFPIGALIFLLARATTRPSGGLGPGGRGPYGGMGPHVGPGPYGHGPYSQGPYGQGPYSQGPYGQGPYGQGPYSQGPYSQGPYGQGPYSQGAPGPGRDGGGPGQPAPPLEGAPAPGGAPDRAGTAPQAGGPNPPPDLGGLAWAQPAGATPTATPVDPSGLPLPPHPREGWYVDPTERFFLRYWDGRRWTDRVASGGHESTDPPVPGR